MSDATSHLEQMLERDMQGLRDRIRKLGALVQRQLEDAVTAFVDSNRALAYTVVLKDHSIDVMESNIDRLTQEFLVRHMPVSEQLRFVVACAKVNSELERIGDYAEGIARRAVRLSAFASKPFRDQVQQMSEVAFQMLAHAVDSFLASDAENAMRTLETDAQVDRMNSAIFQELARPEGGPDSLEMRFALLGLVGRIERVADRACNIAEETVYVARGQVLRHLPRTDVRVLFVCDKNDCRSQMAEGIARNLAPQHFLFSSAGAAPAAPDPRAVEFLARQGIDISRQRAKGLDVVMPLEDFNVVVTMSSRAEEALPPKVPYNVVQLRWEMPDPAAAKGSPDEVEQAYRAAFDNLSGRIRDLTQALAGAAEEVST
jgi:phosphate transport system protein